MLAGLYEVGSKGRVEMFDKYRRSMFPFIHRTEDNSKKRISSILDRAFSSGPIRIKPISEE